MFYIDFWGFTNDPLYLVYNSAGQENPVLGIFNFQGPKRSQMDLGFFEDYFFMKTNTWSTRTSRAEPGGPKEPRWRGPGVAAPPMLVSSSSILSRPSSTLTPRLDLKMPIKRSPDAISERGEREHRNTETEPEPAKIGGGNAAGAIPVGSPSSPTSPSPSPWWRGSSPPLDYGFVAVAWSLSLVPSLFRTIWAALHDYGHICNSYVGDLCFMRWYLRLEFYYVYDVLIDAYYVPRS